MGEQVNAVIRAWLDGSCLEADRVSTNGRGLFSYGKLIGEVRGDAEVWVARQHLSATTTGKRHIRKAVRMAEQREFEVTR